MSTTSASPSPRSSRTATRSGTGRRRSSSTTSSNTPRTAPRSASAASNRSPAARRRVTPPREPRYLVCATDADYSIVACTRGWLDVCGYEAGEVLRRNCRFLQGPLTCFETIARLRAALKTRSALAVRLVNYAKDGRPFLNEFLMCPLVSKRGGVAYYISVHDPPEDLLLKVRTVTPPQSTSPPE